MNPLDIGDDLIDREKSRIFLHYLAQASKKLEERHMHRRTGSIDEHINKALHAPKESHHHKLHEKVKQLEHKLSRYSQTKNARQRRVEELERKISGRSQSKNERVALLQDSISDLESLKERFVDIPPSYKRKITEKINKLKSEIKSLKRK